MKREYITGKSQLFLVFGKTYKMGKSSSLKVGTVLYDSIRGCFVKLENEKDVRKYLFVAPECYVILEIYED